jgi:outer membrane protein assembly factor BamB
MNGKGTVLTIYVSALLAVSLSAAEWTTFLGPKRDGISPDTGLLKEWPEAGPALLWKNTNVGPGWSSVAVVNDLLYTTGNEGENQMLICLDVKTGKEVWRAAQGTKSDHKKYDGARATPTVDGDRIYLTGAKGLVTCQSAKDGRMIWKKDMSSDFGGKVGGWQYAESVTILGKLAIVVPGGAQGVVALDKMTGEKVWSSGTALVAGYASLLPITEGNDTILVTGTQSGLIAIDAKSGKEIYRNPFAANNTANAPTPAYADGFLFWSVGYNKGSLCLKVTHANGKWSFEEAWTSTEMGCHPGNFVIANRQIFGKGKRGLTCLDLKSGQTLWTTLGYAGQAFFADGRVYSLADQGGKLALIEPLAGEGRIKGKLQVQGNGNSWSHPVVINGRLFVRYDTNLYCFDVKAK